MGTPVPFWNWRSFYRHSAWEHSRRDSIAYPGAYAKVLAASRATFCAAHRALARHPHRKAKEGLLNIWFYEILSSITRKAPGTAKVYGSHIRRRPFCSGLRVGKSPRTPKQPLHWSARNSLTESVHLCWTAVQIIWPMRKRRWRDSKEVWQTSNRQFGHSAALFGFGSSMSFPVVKV